MNPVRRRAVEGVADRAGWSRQAGAGRAPEGGKEDVTAVTSLPEKRLVARPSAFLALAAVVVTGGVVLRLALLGRQSYWIDELYSVNQSNGSLRQLLDAGAAEVHPPLYALLLWAWMKIGGSSEAWTHLLSTVIAVLAVAVTHAGLRHLDLGRHVRWAMTTATAAGSAWAVYSLETRNYSLLLLGAAGLTVTTLRAGVLALRGEAAPARLVLAWFGWTLLAATAHPFGAVLSAGAVAVLAGAAARSRSGHWLRTTSVWTGSALAGWIPLAVWVEHGVHEPEFAAGTRWIRAPGGQDVWDLVTTAFGSGGMSAHRDGFAWTSPLGALGVAVLVAAALAYRPRSGGGPDDEALPGDVAPAARILLALTVVVTAGAFAVSQVWHLWTLRNMLVIVPALTWGVICLAAAASGSAAGSRWTATAAVVLLGAGLLPTATGIARPYKTDFRGLLDYLVTVQRQEPGTTVVVLGYGMVQRWWPAADRPANDWGRAAVTGWLWAYPGTSLDVDPVGKRPVVVVLYHSVADPLPYSWVSATVQQLGADSCRSVPVYGFGVVRCG
jgi:hypothetical protein